jgi:RHS repeat-associated protein
VTDAYTNDAYGNSIASSGSSTNPMKWNGGSGYYSDAESGLQKVGARYYDPTIGRFISQDSLLVAGSPADSQALNRYNYCQGDPVNATDPSGHRIPAVLTKIALTVLKFTLEAMGLGGDGKTSTTPSKTTVSHTTYRKTIIQMPVSGENNRTYNNMPGSHVIIENKTYNSTTINNYYNGSKP